MVAWLASAGCVLYVLHRVAMWMEAQGWMYYRKKRGSSGALGTAFLEVQAMFEPGKRHVLEVMRTEETHDGESGEPPTGGPGSGTNSSSGIKQEE